MGAGLGRIFTILLLSKLHEDSNQLAVVRLRTEHTVDDEPAGILDRCSTLTSSRLALPGQCPRCYGALQSTHRLAGPLRQARPSSTDGGAVSKCVGVIQIKREGK